MALCILWMVIITFIMTIVILSRCHCQTTRHYSPHSWWNPNHLQGAPMVLRCYFKFKISIMMTTVWIVRMMSIICDTSASSSVHQDRREDFNQTLVRSRERFVSKNPTFNGYVVNDEKLYLNNEINVYFAGKVKVCPAAKAETGKAGPGPPTGNFQTGVTQNENTHMPPQPGLPAWHQERSAATVAVEPTQGPQTSCQPQPKKLKEIKLLFFRGEL